MQPEVEKLYEALLDMVECDCGGLDRHDIICIYRLHQRKLEQLIDLLTPKGEQS